MIFVLRRTRPLLLAGPIFFIYLIIVLSACKRDEVSLGNFRALELPTNDDLSAVWATDELVGYLCGGRIFERGFILSTRDGGQTWQTDTLIGNKLENIHFDATGQGYACGLDGFLFARSTVTGLWERMRQDYCWSRACFFKSPGCGIAVAGEGWRGGQIRRFAPQPWALDTMFDFPNELDAVWFSDSATVHAVGSGWVLRSTDAGRSWQRTDVPNDFYKSVHFPDAKTGYVCAQNGTILKTTDAGMSWHTLREGNSIWTKDHAMKSIWFASPDTGYVVGDAGLFWRTTNGGESWQQVMGAPDDADFTDVFVRKGQGWATANGGRAFRFSE